MIRLVTAELLRLRSRKLTWIAFGAVLLVVLLSQLVVYSSVKPLTNAERAEAQSSYQSAKADYDKNKDEYAEQAKECVAQGNSQQDCEYPEPKLEDFGSRTVATFGEVAGLTVTVSVFVTALALLLLSASMVGAEFSSGSLANWLSFVPERTKVYLSKLVALLLTGAVATAVTSALALGLTALLTRIAGAAVTGVGKYDAMGARGVLVGVIGVVIGFTLAMLTRHTIAAAATVLGYLFVSFVLAIVMLVVPSLQRIQRLTPENNALALLQHGRHYTTTVRSVTASGPDEEQVDHVITLAQASVYWLVVLLVLLAASYLVFRRRDVN